MTYTDKELKSLLVAWGKITSVRSEDRKAIPLTPNDPATIARLASELIEAKKTIAQLWKAITKCCKTCGGREIGGAPCHTCEFGDSIGVKP